MHLRDVNRTEVSITVDVDDTTKELLEGEDSLRGSQKPHMVLTLGDERCIQGMMLTGWMGKADLLKGWASQGKRKDRPASEARGKGAGEQTYFKHLKVRTEGTDAAHLRALQQKRARHHDRVRGSDDPRSEGRPDSLLGDHSTGNPGTELRLVRRTSSGHGWAPQAGESKRRAEDGPCQE
jgi:hypothetical protein